jgi:hypothetical protein
VLARLALRPAQHALGVVGEPVPPFLDRPDTGLVDPAAEVGRGGDVGAACDQPPGRLGRIADQVGQQPTQRRLSRARLAVRVAQRGRDSHLRTRLDGSTLQGGAAGAAELVLGATGGEGRPRVVDARAAGGGQGEHLLLGEQRGVVVRMALDCQATALDGVREHHRWSVVVDVVEGVGEQAEVVPAEVTDGARKLLRAKRRDQRPQIRRGLVSEDARGDVVGAHAQHPLVLLVRHLLQPAAQFGTAWAPEDLGDGPAPLQGQHLPPSSGEHSLQSLDLDVGDDPVQRLAVQVDHPQQLAERGNLRVRNGLPDGALVEFGVTQQADEPARLRRVRKVRLGVAVRHRRP